MSLFYFELRKLLFNKKTSLLLLCLFVLYSVIGVTSTIFLIGSNDSYRAYEEIAVAYEGSFDNEKAAEAERIYNEVSVRYGTDSRMIARSVKDQPEIILAVNYYAYARQVEEYWNGTPPESAEEPYGIALLKSKLTELESQEKQDTFAYRELSDTLQCLIELAERRCFKFPPWSEKDCHSEAVECISCLHRCSHIVFGSYLSFRFSSSRKPAWMECCHSVHSHIRQIYVPIQGLAARTCRSRRAYFYRCGLQPDRQFYLISYEKPDGDGRYQPSASVCKCGIGGNG